MRYILPLLFLCSILSGQERRDPFSLQTVTPELTTSGWSQFLGVGLNYMLNPTKDAHGKVFYETNQWFTTGKGNPFTSMDKLAPSATHTLDISYGTLTITSEEIEERAKPLLRETSKLQISYDLTLPINPLNGLVYVSITCNAPIPALQVGEQLRLGVWLRGDIQSASHEDLNVSGALATFGGDIFTEQVMRLMLSYRPPEMRYFPPVYSIRTDTAELQIGPQRVPEVAESLRALRRAHSADSPRGLQAKNGFFLSPQWTYVTSRAFRVSNWDIQSGIISFELVIQLPYSDTLKEEGAVWDNVKGIIELAGFDWWIEAS